MKTLAVLFSTLLAGAAAAQTVCFESNTRDIAKQTPWSHQFFVVQVQDPIPGAPGRPLRSLFGYGYNDAGDRVPFTGSAVRNDQDQWVVSIVGTLHQHSTLFLHDDVPEVRYWLISQNWEFDPPGIESGNSHQGNIIESFGDAFPVTHNDSFDSFLVQLPCEEVTK
jgi:hypothetical protein